MLILSIDTSTVAASVAVISEEKLHGIYYTDYKLKHSEKLLPLVDGLLSEIGMEISHMDAFALSIGPGSFTGLRIGAATIKAYAYAAGKEIIPVSTLEALAYSKPHFDGIICPVLDAQRDQVYCAMFRNKNGKVIRLSEDGCMSVEDFCREVTSAADGMSAIFLGDGVRKFRDSITGIMGDKAVFSDSITMMPCAAYVGAAALESDRRESAFSLELNYIRKAQAEENLKK